MEKLSKGYYMKARSIQQSNIAKAPPHIREIWDWLLMNAFYQDTKSLKRGQLLTSYKEILDGLSWQVGWRKESYTKWDCEKAMKWLTKEGMVTTRKTIYGMLIEIVKYSYYQDPNNYEDHNVNHKRATREPQTTDTLYIKNNKNIKNNTVPTSKNSLTPCTDEELQAIADSLKVSVENVKLLHSQIIDLIADGTFQKKRYGQTVYFTLRKWMTMRIAEGKFKNVTSSIVDKYPTFKSKYESN